MEAKLHRKLNKSKSVKNLKEPVRYIPDMFGFDIPNYNPSDITIAILDTGIPSHFDINYKEEDNKNSCIDLLLNKCEIKDINGHATIISGILCGSNPSGVMGMCPSAKYMFCKIMNDDGLGDTSNITAGLLWAMCQKFDILLLSSGSPIDDRYMKKVIDKCYAMNKIIIVASGKEITKNSKSLFPAGYDGVISCSSARKNSAKYLPQNKRMEIDLSFNSIWSTFIDDTYIKSGGSSVAAAIVCGAAANFLHYLKSKDHNWETASDFMKLFSEKIRNQ
jgi:subtilisin family serine protease